MKLFSTYEMRSIFKNILNSISIEVQSKDKNYLLNVNEEDYINYLYKKYSIEKITLIEDKIYGTTIEKMIDPRMFPWGFNVYEGK